MKSVDTSVEVDLDAHRLTVGGEPVAVTATQLRLLAHLMKNRGRVVSRADLLRDVWGYHQNMVTRTIDIHVYRLRSKLGPAGASIETVRSVGYRMSTDEGNDIDERERGNA